ncbi:outer membrane beta-barrel protein [Vibrio furnissii]|uniref:outer membrane beta-barrel protein n=1 Tax=Vibrio furnissii TaxID=29494 RepID=UPI001EEC0787|nr:outer membrane beta-barrel protein [Vibrio furnissii]MCG6267273.1 porin family protein [Vibrio furnissii]
MNISNQFLFAFLAVGAVTISPAAFSAPYVGAELGYSDAEYQPDHARLSGDGNPINIGVQAGYFLNDYLGLEARYSRSVQRSSGLKVDELTSGFAKLNLPVTPRIALYGLAGYSTFTLDKQGVASVDESGFSFGGGIHFALDRHKALALDVIRYADADHASLYAMNLAFQYRF